MGLPGTRRRASGTHRHQGQGNRHGVTFRSAVCVSVNMRRRLALQGARLRPLRTSVKTAKLLEKAKDGPLRSRRHLAQYCQAAHGNPQVSAAHDAGLRAALEGILRFLDQIAVAKDKVSDPVLQPSPSIGARCCPSAQSPCRKCWSAHVLGHDFSAQGVPAKDSYLYRFRTERERGADPLPAAPANWRPRARSPEHARASW